MSGLDPLSAGIGLEDVEEIEGTRSSPLPLRADVWRLPWRTSWRSVASSSSSC